MGKYKRIASPPSITDVEAVNPLKEKKEVYTICHFNLWQVDNQLKKLFSQKHVRKT